MATAGGGPLQGSGRPSPIPWPPGAPRPEWSCSPCTQAPVPCLCSTRGAAWPLPHSQSPVLAMGEGAEALLKILNHTEAPSRHNSPLPVDPTSSETKAKNAKGPPGRVTASGRAPKVTRRLLGSWWAARKCPTSRSVGVGAESLWDRPITLQPIPLHRNPALSWGCPSTMWTGLGAWGQECHESWPSLAGTQLRGGETKAPRRNQHPICPLPSRAQHAPRSVAPWFRLQPRVCGRAHTSLLCPLPTRGSAHPQPQGDSL